MRRNLMRRLCAILMVCAAAFSAEFAFGENINIGDYSYSYSLSTKEGTITKYNGSDENIIIPSTFSVPETYRDSDGETHTRHHTITVTAIGSSAYANNTSIKTVIFHDKLTSIGSSAFKGCIGLESIRTSASLRSLGYSAFRDCTALEDAEIDGDGLDLYWCTSIFTGCKNLKRLKIGDGVVGLECNNGDPRMLQGCNNLQAILFKGAPPSTYRNSFSYVDSGTIGTYTAEHAAAWEAVIDNKGYWNGLKMKPSYYTVIYDANNGTGARTTATVEWGEPTPAGDGTFTWEAHYFMGWAFEDVGGSTLGSNDVIPEPQEGNTVTLYGQWATFEPVAADWGTGSITLKATGVSLKEGEDFFLSYCDAATAGSDGAQWEYVDDFGKTVDGNSVSLTDTQFSSRLGGIPAVRYRLQIGKSKEDVRASLCCTTRNRHAIFVGLNEWDGADLKPSSGDRDANNFFNIAAIRGGFTNTDNIHVLLNGGAKADDVDDAFDSVAESVQTGDIFLFYFRTHGGYDKSDGTTFLCLYDEDYTDTALATKIQAVEANGKSVAIIGIVAACHAGGMYDPDVKQDHWYVTNGLGRCSANVAWIAAADREHTSYAVFNRFMLDYGWEEGWAGNNATLSFLDLATYTKNRYEALLGGIKSYEGWNVQIENPSLLGTIVAGTRGSHMNKNPASAVTGVKAETGDNVDEIKAEWNVVDNADEYWLFCERGGVDEFCSAYSCRADETEVKISFQTLFGGREINPSKLPIKCSVKAVNGAGVSVASAVEIKNFARIVFDANGGGISGWRGAIPYQGIVYADITVGSVLGGRLLTLPETYGGSNKEFTGWYSANGVQANPMEIIISDETYVAHWKAKNTGGMTQDWLDSHQIIASAANGDIATAAAMTAANGCRTVGECYALGIDPEDPNDDLKITDFKIEDGKPVITLNHTKDGSGNSFEPRIKTLGKANLTDADWVDVTDKDQSAYRFFKVTVDLP